VKDYIGIAIESINRANNALDHAELAKAYAENAMHKSKTFKNENSSGDAS